MSSAGKKLVNIGHDGDFHCFAPAQIERKKKQHEKKKRAQKNNTSSRETQPRPVCVSVLSIMAQQSQLSFGGGPTGSQLQSQSLATGSQSTQATQDTSMAVAPTLGSKRIASEANTSSAQPLKRGRPEGPRQLHAAGAHDVQKWSRPPLREGFSPGTDAVGSSQFLFLFLLL
jgi:hypothetical protein